MSDTNGGLLMIFASLAIAAMGGEALQGSRFKQTKKKRNEGFEHDLDLLEEDVPELPKECEVWLLNADEVDGFFVHGMLQHAFGMTSAKASRLGLTAHQQGRALVGVWTCEEAHAQTADARELARLEHPPAVGVLTVEEKD